MRDLGLVKTEGQIRIANPIYREVIPRELTYGTQLTISEQPAWYVLPDGRLDLPKLLAAFQQFFREHSESWLERFDYRYVNGQPQSGYLVVFSYAPDGPPATPPVQSGPHAGYEGWNQGFFSHIINASSPQAGNWYSWIVDESGNRISEMANWQFDGPGGQCNQIKVGFDSR